MLIPADVMETLFWHAAGPFLSDDQPSAVRLAGMAVLTVDGMPVSLADTPANRAMFGSTRTADDSAPVPAAAGYRANRHARRALLGRHGGQWRRRGETLLKRLARHRSKLFVGRLTCFERNLSRPRADHRDPGRGLARRGPDERRPLATAGPGGGWLPDGSRT
jgi:hypothetical protein